MDEILKFILPSLTPTVVIILLLLFMPEKIEAWSALLWKWLSNFSSLFKNAHKRYVKHDLQGRVNGFVKRLRTQVPGVADAKMRIDWVDEKIERKAFIDQGELVIRLHRDDPMERNFIHGAYLFVSEMLLKKPKRYVSPSQGEALDLFVCGKILEAEKPSVVSVFIDDYLHPRTQEAKSKVALYVDDFGVIDKGGLFFPVLLQELEFLGDKVFGRRRDDRIIKEVENLIGFLRPIATRQIGDQGDLDHDGQYCRFALVIVGKPSKLLTSIEPYVTYIRNALFKKNVETIYLLGRIENNRSLDEICGRITDRYECLRQVQFSRFLSYGDRQELALQYLVVLRMRGIPIVRTSV
jgi:hypothetical protein